MKSPVKHLKMYNSGSSLSKLKETLYLWWKVTEPSYFTSILNPKISNIISTNPESQMKHDESKDDKIVRQTSEITGDTKENLNKNVIRDASNEVAESIMTKMFHQSNASMKVQTRLTRPHGYSKTTIFNRARFLIKSIRAAASNLSILVRLEEMSKLLHQFPESKNSFIKENSIPYMVSLRDTTKDSVIKGQAREILALLGHIEPINNKGVRILSIDGGGIRGLMALEVLKTLEQMTGKRAYQLFDYMCGVSTGAVLAVLLGALKLPIEKCQELYLKMSKDVFNQSPLWGTGQLVFNHSYYDTDMWEKVLKEIVGNGVMIESARSGDCPKVAVVSTVVNQTLLQAFVFRNYVLPPRVQSHYGGNATYQMWQALRASAAAPGYFEEFKLDGLVHQDGGILMNNPSALALHECKHLWPDKQVQCLVSLGNGRYIPNKSSSPDLSSLKKKISKIVDSATDTEGVHIILHDLLPPNCYFRFNPYLTEQLSLDENREEKMCQLENDAKMYIRRNDEKITSAANQLTQGRSKTQKASEWVTKYLGKFNLI